MPIIDKKTAIEKLKAQEVVALPTETVYGLAGRIDSRPAIESIFRTKERPSFDPLIVHVSSLDMAKGLIKESTPLFEKLASHFWPGPLTLIMEKNEKISDAITAGLPRVGLRLPSHPIFKEIIEMVGIPLAAPSANMFKRTSPTKASHVIESFADKVSVVDGGDCEVGIESTILEVINDRIKIFRPGMISKAELEKISGVPVEYAQGPVAPGQMKEHYRPRVPLYLLWDDDPKIRDSKEWDVREIPPQIVSRELYTFLHSSQGQKALSIRVKNDFRNLDLWQGILNRLEKAAFN